MVELKIFLLLMCVCDGTQVSFLLIVLYSLYIYITYVLYFVLVLLDVLPAYFVNSFEPSFVFFIFMSAIPDYLIICLTALDAFAIAIDSGSS